LICSEHHLTQQASFHFYFTKLAAVGPGNADCPRWKAHLRRILNDDPDLISYLQRVLGYALTGSTREHALFFGYGTGANGKGVTVNTISPGYIGTQMVMAIPKEVLDSKIIPQIPMGRLGKPEEVAGLVAYLASEEAAFVTGANIAINGGQHMQ